MTKEELYERLAAIEHERWADWQRHLHSKMVGPVTGVDGPVYVIAKSRVDGWNRQIDTPYADLTEREKQSDREQVDRYWPLIEEMLP